MRGISRRADGLRGLMDGGMRTHGRGWILSEDGV